VSAQAVAVLLLSSSVLSAALTLLGSAALAGVQRKHEFLKELGLRRLRAYEDVGALLAMLRTVMYTDGGRLAHVALCGDDEYYLATLGHVARAIANGIYLTEELRDGLVTINAILLCRPDAARDSERMAVATSKYGELSTARHTCEGLIARDFLTLHQVERHFTKEARDRQHEENRREVALPASGAYRPTAEKADGA